MKDLIKSFYVKKMFDVLQVVPSGECTHGIRWLLVVPKRDPVEDNIASDGN